VSRVIVPVKGVLSLVAEDSQLSDETLPKRWPETCPEPAQIYRISCRLNSKDKALVSLN
jgi:hypothetical protein